MSLPLAQGAPGQRGGLFFFIMCMCEYECSTDGGQERALDSLEMDLETIVSCQMWELGSGN